MLKNRMNDYLMGFSFGTIGRPSFTKKDCVWSTDRCDVFCPKQPSFATKQNILGKEFFPIDAILTKAERLLITERGAFLDLRKYNARCVLKFVSTEEISKLDHRSFGKFNTKYFGVTVKPRDGTPAYCLSSSFQPFVIAHELLHFCEWKLNLRQDEEFCRAYEQILAAYFSEKKLEHFVEYEMDKTNKS